MSHQIEPELQSAPPRPITRRAGHGHFINFMHIFLAPHALVGIGLVFMLLFGIAHSFFGTQVEALVLGKSESSTKKGPSYSLRYEYQLPGKRIFAEESVSWRLYAKLHQGAVVKVKALAIGPFSTENLLEAEPKIPILFIFLFMLLWNGCLLGGFIWPLVIVPLLQRSLVREGRPIPGFIVYFYIDKRKRGNLYYIKYGYAPADQQLTREMRIRKEDYAAAVVDKSSVTILYDPKRPLRSVIYRYAPYKAF